ncbi:hypothetical protein CKM354_000588600 [Cercospora kikuchii]|uniref:FAS1 domain-containing protein n=1 Tax=Cercospora kikuchii TaxID=84275 RepID=A0A9P3CH41_9PEZI|nr:uncharacterized protein CKM354_000588600 [Cercospora kikuchii]GIZ42626.1 hypothetical protein CKM354_000588600 [Cercospora kikuchii]
MLTIGSLLLTAIGAVESTVISSRQETLSPLLTTIKNTPELSVFYSLVSSTGGASGIPGPALEERFNNPNNSLQFTAFAPTNDAFSHVSQDTIAALTTPQSYQLLYSILINHIAPGVPTLVDLQQQGTVHAIGGFDISFDAQGELLTNANTTSESERSRDHQATLIKGQDGQPIRMPASNGAIFMIDHVLDGLFTYFGVDEAVSEIQGLPEAIERTGTMRDILETTPELSTLDDILQGLRADFLTRLSLASSDAAMNNRTVFLAPSNTAFEALPSEAVQKALQPSNYDLSAFLLRFGLGEVAAGDAGGVLRRIKSQSGFEILLEEGRANNARVEKRICADNGCVWVMGRWLDPLWKLF